MKVNILHYWPSVNSLWLWDFLGSSTPGGLAAAAAAKSLQSCPTLCDPIDGSPPSSPIPGILQARTLEWVAISFSNAWKWKVKVKSFSGVWLLACLTAAYQAPPSMGFSRQHPLNEDQSYTVGSKFEPIIQSEVSQKEKHQYSILTHIYGI